MRLRRLAAALAVAGLTTVSAASAAAATDGDGLDHLREYWTNYGVSEQTQQNLVEEYKSGNMPDSFTGEDPVDSEVFEQDGKEVTVLTYEDGSVSHQSIDLEVDPDEVSTRGISGCSQSSGPGYTHYSNCLVSAGNGDFYLSFRVSYDRYGSKYCDAITSHGSANPSSPSGSMTRPTVSLERKQSTTTRQAVVKYHSVYTSALNGNNEDVYLGFWLTCSGSRSYSTS